MKKFLSIAAWVFFAMPFLAAHDVVTTDEKQLPTAARHFLSEHFTSHQISYIKMENEMLKGKRYEVVLTDGTEIDFDSKGNWYEVDCKRNPIPTSVLPVYVKDYVNTNFKNNLITKIERDRRGVEVELDNGLNLKFDKNGKFYKLDD